MVNIQESQAQCWLAPGRHSSADYPWNPETIPTAIQKKYIFPDLYNLLFSVFPEALQGIEQFY